MGPSLTRSGAAESSDDQHCVHTVKLAGARATKKHIAFFPRNRRVFTPLFGPFALGHRAQSRKRVHLSVELPFSKDISSSAVCVECGAVCCCPALPQELLYEFVP